MACRVFSRRRSGVTLTEILVAVVVLGMLVAICIPAYRAYVIRVNRGDALRDLMALAGQLHRCYERAADYRVDAAGSSTACVKLPANNAEGTYAVSFAAGGPGVDSFRLVASPRGAQVSDSGCADLWLDDRGQRGVTGSRAPQDCWQGQGD